MDDTDRIRSLVCERCWTDVFCSVDFGGPDPIIRQGVTVIQVQASAETGCTCCSLVLSIFIENNRCGQGESSYRITLERADLSYALSLAGHDGYQFELRGDHWGTYILFGAYATSKSIASASVKTRPPLGEVASPTAYAQIHRWLEKCNEHSTCPSQVLTTLPSRVIEVSPIDSLESPRLICSGDRNGRYAALSYC